VYLPPRTISITVNSVPQEGTLKVDGTEGGVTPKIIQVAPGKHMLEFGKDGFNKGHFPLEITPDDSIELRDGSVLSGDVESVSSTELYLYCLTSKIF